MSCVTDAVDFMRKQYEYTWMRNTQKIEVKVVQNEDASDYFNLGEPRMIYNVVLYLNLNTQSSDYYEDKEWSNVLASKYHAYATYDQQVRVNDFVIIDKRIYRIQNFNATPIGGQILFKEFDLVYVNDFLTNTDSAE